MNSSSPAPWEPFKELFSLDLRAIEEQVEDLPGHYKDLDPRALYTTLEDLYLIMSSPYVAGSWTDLGAGTGASVLLYASLFPDRKSVGIECARPRVIAGEGLRRKLKISNALLLEGDLLTCEVPDSETYFLYFPTGHVLDRVLCELRNKSDLISLIVIESHGDLLPRLKKENWLQVLAEIPLTSSRHYPNAVVFTRAEAPFIEGPHQLSFVRKHLLIRDEDGMEWIGDTFGLEWLRGEQYQLAIPPRTIGWDQVVQILDPVELVPDIRALIDIRSKGEVEIETSFGVVRGCIRKIRVGGSFQVEISSGEWVKWENIRTIKVGNILCYDSSLA